MPLPFIFLFFLPTNILLYVEKLIDISDPVYTFCDVMDHIDLTPYFVEAKGYKTGRPRCDAEKLLKVILFAFMENGYCSLSEIKKLCNNDIRCFNALLVGLLILIFFQIY